MRLLVAGRASVLLPEPSLDFFPSAPVGVEVSTSSVAMLLVVLPALGGRRDTGLVVGSSVGSGSALRFQGDAGLKTGAIGKELTPCAARFQQPAHPLVPDPAPQAVVRVLAKGRPETGRLGHPGVVAQIAGPQSVTLFFTIFEFF